jgi:tetratricopeptide (TPR) repeat protein
LSWSTRCPERCNKPVEPWGPGSNLRPIFLALKEIILAGIKRHQNKDLDGALKVYDAVLGKMITEPYTLHCAGTLFTDMKLYGIAAQLMMRCIETSPHDADWLPETYMNLGVALRNEAHEEEAKACYRRFLELRPDDPVGWANLSGVYINYGEPDKCIAYADKALSLDPKNVQARHHRAMALLEMEKWEPGFKQYEARLELPDFHDRKYEGARWNGEKTGTLVVHGEQGKGDEVMFCSLIERVKPLCERVVIECHPGLVSLFERSFGVKCYGTPDEVKKNEKTDAWIAMGSLPRVFGLKAPLNHKGYLKADSTKSYTRSNRFRIGVSWRGGTKRTHEHLRNFDCEDWKKLLDPDFEWVSLQYGDCAEERKEMGLVDSGWTGDLDDFASLVESCDLVVTICNTTVHFAGALNKPCWVLVPSKPAWRYGSVSDRMLWYPSVRMFRQGKTEEWSSVIQRIKPELEVLKNERISRAA